MNATPKQYSRVATAMGFSPMAKANLAEVHRIAMRFGAEMFVFHVGEWTEKLSKMGVQILSLSDTVGTSSPETIDYLFKNLIPLYPQIEFGAHLHTTPNTWYEKVDAAYKAGCNRFDGAIQGFGGCPMAKDELTGNMPTEKLLSYFTAQKSNSLNALSFESAHNEASKIFKFYH